MDKVSPFDKLRLPKTARRAAACLVGGMGLAARAFGAPVATPVTLTVNHVKWQSVNRGTATIYLGGGATAGNAFGISDAKLLVPNRGDAFDGAAGIAVNGTAYNPPGTTVDRLNIGRGIIITAPIQGIGGVNTNLSYLFSNTRTTVRALGVFTNTTGAAQVVNVAFGGNLGSDSNTTIRGSSNGNTTYEAAADRWVITSDLNPNTGDPVLTHALFGPGGVAPNDGRFANNIVGADSTITIAPGQTSEMLWFVNLSTSVAAAQAGTADFVDGNSLAAAGLLSGLSITDIEAIKNWILPYVVDSGQTVTGTHTVSGIVFQPGGSLALSGLTTVTNGPVSIVGGSALDFQGGTLAVNQLKVLPGGILSGVGGINGTLIMAGFFSPGHSPGEFRVSGNYIQTPTGVLRIEVGGTGLNEHDLLTIGGAANLDGTLQLAQLNGYKLKRHQPVTFLTAGAGVNGKFANVISNFPTDTIIQPLVVYHGNSVSVEGGGSYEAFALSQGLTRNEKSVARGVDSVAFRNTAPKLVSYLDNRPLSKLPGDFDKISPEALTSIYTLGTSLAKVQAQNYQRRTDDIRSGSSGFSAAGLAINGQAPGYSGTFGIQTGVAGPSGDDGKESKEMKSVIAPDNRWGAFLSGTGEWVSVQSDGNARGYNLDSGGFTLGIDYKVTPNFAIGIAAGYTGTAADLTNRGRIFVNGGKLGLYATFFQNEQLVAPTMSKDSSKEAPAPAGTIAKGFYADMAVFGGYNSYDTRRGTIQGEARGDTDGGELDALFGLGYDFKKGGLTFGPTASFNYTYVGLNGFTEHGSLAPLNIHGGKGDSLRTAFGFKASYDWKVGGILIKPEIRAAWQHEYGDSAYDLTSNFAEGSGNSFLVNGPELGRDSVLLGAGFAIQCSERFSTYFYYDGELGRTNYHAANVTGGVRLAF